MVDATTQGYEARREAKRRLRLEAIDRLQDEAKRAGGITDRLYWTMVYDFELAPLTTNLAQLRDLGIDVPPADSLDEPALSAKLWQVIKGLARLHVFLISTDHLTDRELYHRLESRVLREEVREVPPEPGVREYIDLGTGDDASDLVPSRRDATLPRPVEPN
ncbi:MAG: hypothetical protein ACO3SJ_10230 [Phycisphaerales bacterium]